MPPAMTPQATPDSHDYPLYCICGDHMTHDGFINNLGRSRILQVRVRPNGTAYDALHGYPLRAEVWGDGARIGRVFSPDVGELSRCGIIAVRCGTATDDDLRKA